jgi:SPP1 family predicted phage head-tail adaptor
MKKAYRETFNDGFLEYGHKQTQRTEKGKRIGESFHAEGKLAYKELSCRESDFQMAGIMGASLDLKVKTLYPPSFRTINKSKLKVSVSGSEYDVIKVDTDSHKFYLFFYLQKVGGGIEREV